MQSVEWSSGCVWRIRVWETYRGLFHGNIPLGNEPSGSIKCWGNYRVAAQLVASREVLTSTELVSWLISYLVSESSSTTMSI
jgi:hypothetical protein